ncbi:hypothetical protein, partial [Pseudomonas bubulae]
TIIGGGSAHTLDEAHHMFDRINTERGRTQMQLPNFAIKESSGSKIVNTKPILLALGDPALAFLPLA